MNIFNSLHICPDNPTPFKQQFVKITFVAFKPGTVHCFRASTLVAEWQYLSIITYVHNFEVVRLMWEVFFPI